VSVSTVKIRQMAAKIILKATNSTSIAKRFRFVIKKWKLLLERAIVADNWISHFPDRQCNSACIWSI